MRILEYVCATIAILFHGAGHFIAGKACGISFGRLRITPTGFRLQTESADFPSYESELLAALGGPLGNLLGNAFLIFAEHWIFHGPLGTWIHQINVNLIPISMYLAIWNLMPIDGFDGGRMLRCLLCMQHPHLSFLSLSPERTDKILQITSAFCLFLLWFCAVYLLLRTKKALSLYWFCIELFLSLYKKHEFAQ